VVIEHSLHPLLPLATLIDERVTQPHPRTKVQSTHEAVEVPGRTLQTLMRERHHDRIDLLKVDIEGPNGR
jgi:hypothetical protein